jgi:hypothetical protein
VDISSAKTRKTSNVFDMNKKKIKKKLRVYKKRNTAGDVESVIVELNIDGCIEKRYFTNEKAAYEYIDIIKTENR